MKVLNMGSLNFDYVYSVDHMVQEGETICATNMETFLGGKGINQSIALARAGVTVSHAGLVGEDGQPFLDLCHENRIDTRYIRKVSGKSGHAIIQIDQKAQNCILLHGGANQCFTEDYIDFVLKDFREGDVLLLQNEVNLLSYIIDQAYEKQMTIVLNPSPYNQQIASCNLEKVSVMFLNEIEGSQITGVTDIEKILEALNTNYPNTKIILTLGTKGSVYQFQGEQYKQEAYLVKAIDTTAAGDTFTGYFIAAFLEHMPVQDALLLSTKASAIAVCRKGAIDSIPDRQEVETWEYSS